MSDIPAARLPSPRPLVSVRSRPDRLFRAMAGASGAVTLVVMVLIGTFLAQRSWPALRDSGLSFFTGSEWSAERGVFGIAALLFGTVVIALIALAIAVPVALGAALFINEYAPRWLRGPITSLVDLLAAVPSLIYGLWGFFFLQEHLVGISRWLSDHAGNIPIFEVRSDRFPSSPFVAGVVLSLMVVPICTSVVREVFSQAPPVEKEGALALGGSRWGMIRAVVLPFGRGGIIGGAMLGLGRALGETIAVAIIISPIFEVSPRILEQGGNSVASNIVNKFPEAGTLELSALMASGLALFALTLAVNAVATVVVNRSRSGQGVDL